MRIFVTGFGPFGEIAENPSAELARKLGLPYEILPVTFDGYESWAEQFDPEPFDALLHLGVAAKSTAPRLEMVAKDCIGEVPDIAGCVKAGCISGEGQRESTLWTGIEIPPFMTASHDAGTYLCNFALYQSLTRFPQLKVGFLHVPEFSVMPEAEQLDAIQELLSRLRGCFELTQTLQPSDGFANQH